MIDALKRFFSFRAEGHEGIDTPSDEEATFLLTFDSLPVAILRLHQGTWEFRYTSEFKSQHALQPLIDFPDGEKVYRASELWPFFMARIPSLAQPKVQEAIAEEGLDQHSDVALLRRFGKKTISNPFVLAESS